jgi:sugar/nucleoside kinase (ribokinase family)
MDFIAIGDSVVDTFINLKDARVHCDIDNNNCTISMRWGDKIPFETAETVVAVGNAANAAVSSARLGLSTGFISNVGKDTYGDQIIEALAKENIDTRYIAKHEAVPTNHHYVLSYEGERTILIRHEAYDYHLPKDLEAPKWMYLSSVADHTEEFHDELAAWLAAHPETKLTFQPGTFQMKMGKERLAALYKVSEVVAVNKEEAARILGIETTDIKVLLEKMRALGPKIALITDGPNGAYAYDGSQMLKVPRYPDPRAPVNRTGAGDAMASTFSVALTLGKSLAEALVWGPVNSMSVIQHTGAQKGLVSREELLKFIREAPPEYCATPL